MDYGKVDESLLDKIDFSLPPDHPMTDKVLSGKKTDLPAIYIGCAKWGRPDWIGKVYPKGVKEKDFLSHYVRNFNSIELNAFFYRIFDKATVQKWAEIAPKGFKFCPKVNQSISHFRRFKNTEPIMQSFYDSIHAFGPKLGNCFLQLPPNYGIKNIPELHLFLDSLDRDYPLNIEFRHPEWFKSIPEVEDFFEYLHKIRCGSVITDASGRRDGVNMMLTTRTAFIRFVGNNLHHTDYKRIDEWALRIKNWLDRGLRQLYFFVHNDKEINSPELCKYTIQQVNKVCGLHLAEPIFLKKE